MLAAAWQRLNLHVRTWMKSKECLKPGNTTVCRMLKLASQTHRPIQSWHRVYWWLCNLQVFPFLQRSSNKLRRYASEQLSQSKAFPWSDLDGLDEDIIGEQFSISKWWARDLPCSSLGSTHSSLHNLSSNMHVLYSYTFLTASPSTLYSGSCFMPPQCCSLTTCLITHKDIPIHNLYIDLKHLLSARIRNPRKDKLKSHQFSGCSNIAFCPPECTFNDCFRQAPSWQLIACMYI